MSEASRVEVERIAEQIRRAYAGPSWHGPAVKELLAGITAEKAARRSVAAHTIGEIAMHIAAWKSIVRSRVLGEPAQEISPEQDWPAPPASTEAAWAEALVKLDEAQEELLSLFENLTDAQLAAKLAATPWTIYDLLHGVAQHDLYHAGQIALLKKL